MKKIIALILAFIMSLSCFSLISFAEGTETTEHLTEVPEGYIGVYTKDDLDDIKLNMTGNYILMNDITFEEADYVEGGSFYNSGKGFEPIGTTYSTRFQGVFDGNGYSIHNLYINSPDENYIGLFGYANATIKNIKMENANIKGSKYVGGIVGTTSSSTIDNCSFNGLVDGLQDVGGICGNSGSKSTITKSIVSGEIKGTKNVGGICGYKSSISTLKSITSYCCNTASVKATENAGGIYGYSKMNEDTYLKENTYIQYSYNTGNITSETYAGGFVGYADDYKGASYSSGIIIQNCANIGTVKSNEYTGGFIGYSENSIVQYSYSISNINSTDKYGGIVGDVNNAANKISCSYSYYIDNILSQTPSGTAKSEDQLKKQSTYETWDFDAVWTMEGRDDYPYPELRDVTLIFPEDLTHKHEYTSEVTKEATHLEEGETTYTCTCGDTYTEAISRLEEHTYEKVVTEPTCTTQGYTTYTCECGDSYVDNYVDMLDHEYTSEITTEPTHLTEGIKTFTCNCGDSYTETVAKLTAHTYEKVATEPTCTTQGYTTYTCACGDSYVDDYVGTKEHDYSSTVTTPATHTKEGVLTYTCSACGDSYTDSIAKTPEHTYTNTYVVAPTCKVEGYTAHVCECGDVKKDNFIEKTGHSYNGRICENCGDECSCMCHYSGFMAFIWKIVNFFYKLFRVNKTCACGMIHY